MNWASPKETVIKEAVKPGIAGAFTGVYKSFLFL